MSRPLRVEYEGAFYHVICRGERGDAIFRCDGDKEKFLIKLSETVEKYGLIVHAYVLLDNHYHLLLETPRGNLSDSMHYLNASYGNWYRFKYRIVGSVFQGRYKAILVEKDEYLKVLSAYIHLNPVRAGIVASPKLYPYSSYAYYGASRKSPHYLRTDDLLEMFGSRKAYREYVESFADAGSGIDAEEIYGKSSLLGSEGFLRKALARMKGKSVDMREQPDGRSAARVSTEDILEIMITEMRIPEEEIWSRKRDNAFRKLLAYALRRHTACRLKEIGEVMGMEYSAVSGLARRFEKEVKTDPRLRRMAAQLEKGIISRKLLTECMAVENGRTSNIET
jgi:REP element-mobilizing transposase RayT